MLDLFPRPENLKGMYYFDEQFGRGDRWYRSHFPMRAAARPRHGRRGTGRGRRGDAVLPVPPAGTRPRPRGGPRRAHPRRAARPGRARVLALQGAVRNDTEPLSFAEAIAAEDARLAGEEARIVADAGYVSFAHRHCSYVDQGRYAPMLERWFDAYGRDRVQVEISEEMYADPQATLDRVTDRLGIRRHELRDTTVHNAEPAQEFDAATRAELVGAARAGGRRHRGAPRPRAALVPAGATPRRLTVRGRRRSRTVARGSNGSCPTCPGFTYIGHFSWEGRHVISRLRRQLAVFTAATLGLGALARARGRGADRVLDHADRGLVDERHRAHRADRRRHRLRRR